MDVSGCGERGEGGSFGGDGGAGFGGGFGSKMKETLWTRSIA